MKASISTKPSGPVIMPMMLFKQADPSHLRSYYEKRDLVERISKYDLVPFDNADFTPIVRDLTWRLAQEYRPFDYGRFEFRFDEQQGRVVFLEQNLNCNLWSQKVFGRSAQLAGISQRNLIETIIAESMNRYGLIDLPMREMAA